MMDRRETPTRDRTVTKKILAIDGGGIRGLIPALVLTDIEKRLGGRRIADVFDLIAGTSTGGILAAGLAVPGPQNKPAFAAAELVALYETYGADIFQTNLLRQLVSFVFGSEYPSGALEKRLIQYFGDVKLAEAVTGLLITAYDLKTGKAWFFRRAEAQDESKARNYYLRDIARATSAAPTYFPPYRFSPSSPEVLVDGGMFANNPALCAWVDAYEGIGKGEVPLILSLGTGSVSRPETYERVRSWGKVLWAQPAISAFLDGQSDATEYQVGRLAKKGNYLRLQCPLDDHNQRMDDTSSDNLSALRKAAEKMISDNDAAIDAFCAKL